MRDYLRASLKTNKPVLFVDMDGVLANFDKRANELQEKGIKSHKLFQHPDAYRDLEPIEGAVEAWNQLQEKYECYILSTPAWSNPNSWGEKRIWVEKYLGKTAHKKLILSHNKGLVKGDILIDDRIANGVSDFEGIHVHFGSTDFPDWASVLFALLTLDLDETKF